MDELQSFLQGQSAASLSPNNPMSQGGQASANPSNPMMNPGNPTAWNNPSNPQMNPNLPGAVNNPSNPQYNPGMPGAQNNPSNPARNPAMPGAMNNPSSPALNPSMPGSITNPSNPIHNPDFPVHQEYERPEGVSPDASLPPSRAAGWHLAGDWKPWEPGEYGKGFITPTNNVVHWRTDQPDGYPGHREGLVATGYGSPFYLGTGGPEAHNFFEIEDSGYIRPSGLQTPEGYQHIVQSHPDFTDQAPEQTNLLQRSIRNMMGEHPEWDFSEYVKQYPSEAQYWTKQADNYTQDSREWADPTEPRAAQPPEPSGCTCMHSTDSEAKLMCPIHGLHGQDEQAHDWSMPEGWPVGYPQDQPRTWTQATSAVPPPKHNKFFTTLEQHQKGKAAWHQKRRPKRAVLSPESLRHWNDWDDHAPYLYHATLPDAADHILKEGLYPHNQVEHGGIETLHCPNCAFTTQLQDKFFKEGAPCPQCEDDYLQHQMGASQYLGDYYEPRPDHTYMGTHDLVTKHYASAAGRLLRIDTRKLDPNLMDADEDAFNPGSYSPARYPVVGRVINDEYPPSAEDFGEHGMSYGAWADRANLGQDPEETHHSLFNHGAIAYNGVVPPEAIEEVSRHSGEPLRQSPLDQRPQVQQQAPEPVFAKIEEHDAKLTSITAALQQVVTAINQPRPQPQQKQSRKMVIQRDEFGRMVSIEEV